VRYVDPTGYTPVCGFSYSDPECNTLTPQTTTKPTITTTTTLTKTQTTTRTFTPTTTSTSTPTVTPTTTSTIAAAQPTATVTATASPSGCNITIQSCPSPPPPYLDINIYVDWSNVDYIDAGIDVIGLAVDILTLIPATAPLGVAAQPYTIALEGVGLGKTLVELAQGDPTSFLYQANSSTLERAVIVAARTERMAPVVGSVGSVLSLWLNLEPQITIEWVTP